MIDERLYINKIIPKLERVKEKGDKSVNCKCFVCGDGSSTFKSRGWFILQDTYIYHCFNCNITLSLSSVLKEYFPDIYQDYVFEKLKHNSKESKNEIVFNAEKTIDFKPHNIIKNLLESCNDFPDVIEYLKSRKIPEHNFKNINVIRNFSKLKQIEKYKNSNFLDEKRIVLVNYNSEKLINGIISRAVSATSPKRYINLKIYDFPELYNLYDQNGNYNINLNKTIYVVEGAFDSMFIDNCVAVNTSDLLRVKKIFTDKILRHLDFVFIPDNDKRNPEIIKVYEKIIKNNEKIVIIPDYLKGKDINEIILKNENIDIMSIISENTFKGLEASLKFNNWKKI